MGVGIEIDPTDVFDPGLEVEDWNDFTLDVSSLGGEMLFETLG